MSKLICSAKKALGGKTADILRNLLTIMLITDMLLLVTVSNNLVVKAIEENNAELKKEYIDDIKKALIAFANADGGAVYIGIADDGSATGVNDVDALRLQVLNVIRDAIKPDPVKLCEITVETIQEKQAAKIAVNRGTARPYYLAANGNKSNTK